MIAGAYKQRWCLLQAGRALKTTLSKRETYSASQNHKWSQGQLELNYRGVVHDPCSLLVASGGGRWGNVAQRPRNTWTLLYKNGEELWQQPSLNKCQHTLVLRAEGLAVTLLAAMSFNQFYMPGPCKKDGHGAYRFNRRKSESTPTLDASSLKTG